MFAGPSGPANDGLRALAAGQNTVNRELEARARALAGLKGYTLTWRPTRTAPRSPPSS